MNQFRVAITIFALVFVLNACNSNHFETCNSGVTCPPPTEEKTTPELQALRENFSGKWKFVRVNTIDTLHKTAGSFSSLRADMCVSYNGSIDFFIDAHKPVCAYCYELKKGATELEFKIDASNLTAFCRESLQSGGIKVGGDSLVIVSRDSFVVKSALYRRMNDDGTFKTQ